VKITRRTAVFMGTVLTGSILLAGCSTGSSGDAAPEGADLTAWFMRDSVPEAAQEWLVEEWAEAHDGAELTLETQDWDGYVTKLQTTLASSTQTPDLVEFGNSQVITFSSAGALTDISDLQDDLGGDDLIPSLVASGSYDEALYAAPFYAGSRIIYYSKSKFEAAGVSVPTTIAEVTEAAIALKAANASIANFEGFNLPAKDYGSAMGWLFTHGAKVASLEGDEWKADLSSDEGIAALEELQELYTEGGSTAATATIDEARAPFVPYNEGRAAMFSGLNNLYPKISPELQADTGFFVLPGLKEGTVGKVFAGGSNIGIPAQSPRQDLAKELLAMTFTEEFQSYFASEGGWVPGNSTYAEALTSTEIGAVEVDAVENSVAAPAAEKWGVVEGNEVIRDMLTKVAQGGDVKQIAAETDATLEGILNK
jgi:N,N'-diacetylchitobiose transport system substrate-binding protein